MKLRLRTGKVKRNKRLITILEQKRNRKKKRSIFKGKYTWQTLNNEKVPDIESHKNRNLLPNGNRTVYNGERVRERIEKDLQTDIQKFGTREMRGVENWRENIRGRV